MCLEGTIFLIDLACSLSLNLERLAILLLLKVFTGCPPHVSDGISAVCLAVMSGRQR